MNLGGIERKEELWKEDIRRWGRRKKLSWWGEGRDRLSASGSKLAISERFAGLGLMVLFKRRTASCSENSMESSL